MQAPQKIPFIGFNPDMPQETPGIFTDCHDVIPTTAGFRSRPASAAIPDVRGIHPGYLTGFPLSNYASPGAYAGFVARYTDGTVRVFAASATQLLEGVAGIFQPICGYTFNTAGVGITTKLFPPVFKQFGDDVLFSNGVDPVFILQGKTGVAFVRCGTYVVNEAQTVPNTPFQVILNNGGGVCFGLIVHANNPSQPGPPGPGTIYTLGTDYTVNYNYGGDGQIQVTFIPTSTGIKIGQALYVDYYYGGPGKPGSNGACSTIEAQSFFVFATYDNEWETSADSDDQLYDFTVADLSSGDSLSDTPGEVVASVKFNRNMMAYKNQGIYMATFSGAPVIWNWVLIDPTIGTFGPGCVVNVGAFHVFMGLDDFYINNGSGVTPVPGPGGSGPNGVRQWFFGGPGSGSLAGDLNKLYAYKVQSGYDLQLGLIYWHYPSVNSNCGHLDKWIAWNYRTNTWGKGNLLIDCLFQPAMSRIVNGTVDRHAYFDGFSHQPYQFGDANSVAGQADFTTGDWGDGLTYQFFTTVAPIFKVAPLSIRVQHLFRNRSGGAYFSGDIGNMDPKNENYISLCGDAVWNSFKFTLTGDWEITGMTLDMQPAGEA